MTNKEVAEELFARFSAGDSPGVLALMTDDVTWHIRSKNGHADFFNDRTESCEPPSYLRGSLQLVQNLVRRHRHTLLSLHLSPAS
jgi:hypothetical protein